MSEILGDKLNIIYEDTLLEITPELLKKTIIKQNKEIERLNNIIKEAIEYIEENTFSSYDRETNLYKDVIFKDEITKILDKGE